MTEKSDQDLMLAFRAGDESAFSALMIRHRDQVVSLAYRYLNNRADAEDLGQEVFVRVYRARKKWQPEAKFTTWLYRVTVNACLNEVRNRRTRPTQSAAAIHAGDGSAREIAIADGKAEPPSAALERTELHAAVRSAVDALPDRQRMALLLNKFQGLSYEEMAVALGLTVPAVKSLLVRARESVRKTLEPLLGSGLAGQREIA
jgi:RNA polymerase sigma-70 factor (ECF subfamily)